MRFMHTGGVIAIHAANEAGYAVEMDLREKRIFKNQPGEQLFSIVCIRPFNRLFKHIHCNQQHMSTLDVALRGKNKSGTVSVKKSAIVGLGLMVLIASVSFGQTCTVTGASPLDWTNPGPNCSEGGNAGSKSILKIPSGFTVIFDDNADTWTGTQIEVYGTLTITASPIINASIVVMNGGRLNISGKLSLGSASPTCNYTLAIRTGGVADVGGTGSDRLAICGQEIMKGNGGCNDCGGTNSGKCAYNGSPYCEPSGGFTGPTGYYEGGYDGTLPVKLLNFQAAAEDEAVNLSWTTTTERDLLKFVLQRSENGIDFQDIAEIAGSGANTDNVETSYSFKDKAPLLGFNYYRLKSVDLDETFEFLGLELVKFNGSKHMSVYPNPSSGNSFQVQTNFRPAEDDYIVVSNAMGVDILHFAVNNFDGTVAFENKLLPGVYLVSYVSADFKEVSRVIVRN